MFDLALVAEREPGALLPIRPVLRDRRAAVLARIRNADAVLRNAFAELEVLEYRPSYDDCLAVITKLLK